MYKTILIGYINSQLCVQHNNIKKQNNITNYYYFVKKTMLLCKQNNVSSCNVLQQTRTQQQKLQNTITQ